MRKIVVCILLMVFSFTIYAQDYDEDFVIVVKDKNEGRIFLGFDSHNTRIDQGNGKYSGTHIAGVLGYECKKQNDFYFYLRTLWGGGHLKGTLGGASFSEYNHLSSTDGRLGWSFPYGQDEEYLITPYVGVAYDSDMKALGSGNFQGHHWWMLIAVNFDWRVFPELYLGLNLQSRWKSRVTPADLISGDESLDWLFEIPVTYKFNDIWSISFVPYYFRARFEKSSDQHVTNRRWGGRLETGYSF